MSELERLSDATLDARFEVAHRTGDGAALAYLSAEAARRAQDEEAEAFLLTQAHALGLEAGLPEVRDWQARLVALGAEPAKMS